MKNYLNGLDKDKEIESDYVMCGDVPFPELLNELKWQAKKYHAQQVYRLCMKHKHYKWAMKIAHKYSLSDIGNYDSVMSMAMCLIASNKSKL